MSSVVDQDGSEIYASGGTMKPQIKKALLVLFVLVMAAATTPAGWSQPIAADFDFTGYGFVLNFGPGTERIDLLIWRYNRADGTFSGELRRTGLPGKPTQNVTGRITAVPNAVLEAATTAYKITFSAIAGTSKRLSGRIATGDDPINSYDGALTITGRDDGFIAGTYTNSRNGRVTSGPFPFSGHGSVIPR